MKASVNQNLCVQNTIEKRQEEFGLSPLQPQFFPVLVIVGDAVRHDDAVCVDEGRQLLVGVYS